MPSAVPLSPLQRARSRDREQLDAVGRLMQQLLAAEQRLMALKFDEDVTGAAGVEIARAVVAIQDVRDQLPTLFLPTVGTMSA